uniref:Putative protease inhibitor n=1 Tax=Superstitionia donensis TaxID=311983 RepID=A0A1V1WBY6_9SCOR
MNALTGLTFTFILLCVLHFNSFSVKGDDNCEENEVYTKCGSICESCDDFITPRPCPEICFIGCACKEGYFRDTNEKCIPAEECKKQ